MKSLDRLKTFVKGIYGGIEGSYRGPARGLTHWGSPFQVWFGDGFQDGVNLIGRFDASKVPVAYAAVMATAKGIALCRARHMTLQPDGSHKPSKTSPAARIFRKPNSYESWVQFVTNAVAMMLFDGEAFIQLVRDDRYAITAMHLLPRGSCMVYVEGESGEIYYAIGQNMMNPASANYIAPARDIMHLRAYCPRHPLAGESPISAAALSLGVNVAIAANQQAFYTNMSRPSGVLKTQAQLKQSDIEELRKRFEDQSKQWNAGRIPILSHGLEWVPLGINSQDAELIAAQRMTTEDIARVFGIPLPVIGDLSNATLNNTESTINFWLATGLGYFIELIEESLDSAFNLSADDYIEFDTTALLRMDFKTRVEGLAQAVQGGIVTPNEARSGLDFQPVEGGDDLYLQQQMISLPMLNQLHSADIEAKLRPPPAPDQSENKPSESQDTESNDDSPNMEQALQVIETKMAEMFTNLLCKISELSNEKKEDVEQTNDKESIDSERLDELIAESLKRKGLNQ